MPELVVLAGLPGVGKTTLAKELAREHGYVYLRVDSIETPFSQRIEVEGEGYDALVNIARENLLLGNSVIADLVNPLHLTRSMFQKLAQDTVSEILQFECVLQDNNEHKRRIETRSDSNQHNPTWDEVVKRKYEQWDENEDGKRVILDMSVIENALKKVMESIK